jgi:UDP-N-acetylglucosamine diphosphorylase/glucosamine-1-phosphate N-acetyltransferase
MQLDGSTWRGPAVALFDAPVRGMGPLDDLRSSGEHRLGALTGVERIRLAWGVQPSIEAAPSVRAVVAERLPASVVHDGRELLALNGCCTLLPAVQRAIADLGPGEAIMQGGTVVAARCTTNELRDHVSGAGSLGSRSTAFDGPALASTPWSTLDLLPATLAHDLELLIGHGSASAGGRRADLGDHPVQIAPSATICPGVIIDASQGSVVVAEGATVRPGAILVGPCAVLAGAWIAERAVIKANSVIGPRCKVGGEVGSVIVHGNSNKVHDGHLGDCLVGEWVNIGAGATGSNLLNTYGEVTTRLEPSSSVERTGRIFYGGIVGDHAKVGIMAAITTGSSFGTGAMIACDRPPACVDRFAWLTPERMARYRWDRFEQTMRAVMARRGAEPGPALLDRLRALHAAGEAA